MPNLLKKLRISSVDLCRRGANPLAKIALSKSDDEQWRTRLKELAEDTDAPLTDIADELRVIAAKIGQSAEENAEDEEVVRQHEAVVAKQYAAVCDENELTKRLVQMRAAGGGAGEEYVKLLDELAEAKRVEPLMKRIRHGANRKRRIGGARGRNNARRSWRLAAHRRSCARR